MAGLWEDVKTAGRRVLETAQERSGKQLVDAEQLQGLVQEAVDGRVYRKELEYVGWTILNHAVGQSHELRPESRRLLALKSLNAWLSDPMGGAIVERYIGFVFGRGVPKPAARDAEVQKIIDAAWKDRANRRILTSPEKLAEKGRDLSIQNNVFFLYFDDGLDGMVRMSLLRFETVVEAYRHPEDRFRILYYVAKEKQQKWNPQTACYEEADTDPPKTVYYEAIDAFDPDDPADTAADEGLWTPSAGQVGRGRVLHLATNKTSEMAFGVPQFKRLMRWFTAYNEVLESYVDRMKAAARLYMQANVTGGKSAVERAGLMAVRRAGGLMGDAPPPVEGELDTHRGLPRPGTLGMLAGNESLKYEPFKIDSGASDVASAAPVMRGQVAAGGNFPAHYFGGDPGSLAGSQSVELPVLKFIEQEQEVWARPFRTLADRSIARAVELGFLDEWRDPTDVESEAIAAGTYADEVNLRGQVKRDLTYEFSLPSPLQRAMGDLVSAATTAATAVDPNADFPELSRWLFGFILAEAFDVEDPQKIVDEVMPLERIRQMQQQRQEMQQMALDGARAAATAAADPNLETTTGQDGKQHSVSNPGGAKQKAPNPEDRRTVQAAVDRRARALRVSRQRRRGVDGDFDSVVRVADAQLAELTAATGQEV